MFSASPTSDLNPLLMAARAVAHLASVEGQRTLPVDAGFFTGSSQTAIRPTEVLVFIEIPFSAAVSRETIVVKLYTTIVNDYIWSSPQFFFFRLQNEK